MQEYFGAGERERRKALKEFIEEGMNSEYAYPWDKVVAQSILGSEEFVKKILESQPAAESKEVLGRNVLVKRLTLEQLEKSICEWFDLQDLKSKKRTKALSHARYLFIYLAKEYTMSTNREIGEKMGATSHHAVTNQFTRIRKRLREDPDFCRDFGREADGILHCIKARAGSDDEKMTNVRG